MWRQRKVNKMTYKIIILTFIISQGFSCSYNRDFFLGYDNRFQVKNNSDKSIYFSLTFTYPDTIIGNKNPGLSPNQYKILPGEMGHLSILCCWERIFEPDSSYNISLFIFDAQKIESIAWSEIRTNNDFLKMFKLNYFDLIESDWITNYP